MLQHEAQGEYMSQTILLPRRDKKQSRRIAIVISILLHLALLFLLLRTIYQDNQEKKDSSDLITTMLPAPISITTEQEEEQSGVMPTTSSEPQQPLAQPQKEEPHLTPEPKEEQLPEKTAEPEEQKPSEPEEKPTHTSQETTAVELPQVRVPSRNKWLKKKPETSQKTPTQTRPRDALYKKVSTVLSDIDHENITREKEYKAARSLENEAYARSISKALLAATRAYDTTIYSDTATIYKPMMILIISRDGKLQELKIEPPCKNDQVNQALKEVCSLAKFPPIPPTIEGDRFTLPLRASIELRPGFNPVHFTMSYDI